MAYRQPILSPRKRNLSSPVKACGSLAPALCKRFGAAALLRSVVVEVGARGAGVGHLIIQELERRARAADVTELILLTQMAKPFFERQNYRTIERASVPPAVQASEEFRSLCPESATCMAKTLR